MRKLLRIPLVVAATLALVTIGVKWVAPVVLSIPTARNAPDSARLVPSDLQDRSVSPVAGTKLSYFGYDFEVPWSDIDETKTKLYPNQVIITFRSGLRLMVGASPAKLWVNGLDSDSKVSREFIESAFGPEAAQSDYEFLRRLYELTPDNMKLWAVSPRTHYQEVLLLTTKSIALLPSAKTGFFNVQNQSYRGFQQGNPQTAATINVSLFSDDGSFDFTLFQSGYQGHAAVSQGEINRIVQSLRRSSAGRVNGPDPSMTAGK